MITIKIELTSFHGSNHDQELGTMIIDNITSAQTHLNSKGRKGDYRCRMYAKGTMKKHGNPRDLVANAKHTREAFVYGHARIAEPVQNLVAKALTAMGYK